MQFQCDLLQCEVVRPTVVETTALGAAYLAGLATGYWKNIEEIQQLWQAEKSFEPDTDKDMKEGVAGWKRAIRATRSWSE